MSPSNPWLTTEGLCAELAISRSTLFAIKRSGLLKPGRHLLPKNPGCRRSRLLWQQQRCELVELLSSAPSPLEAVSGRHAEELLSRHGLRVQEGRLLVSNTSEAIARILVDTAWATSWGTILSRLPGAIPTSHPVRFKGAGSKDRACSIPLDSL